MKLITFGVFILALSFCGISEKLQSLTKQSSSNTSSNASSNTGNSGSNTSSTSSSGGDKAEKPSLTSDQQAALDGGQEIKWSDQGITWTLPKGWKEMDKSTKETFNYQSPDNAFLLVNISSLGSSFPVEQSLKAYYESSIEKIKEGKYENARYLEIDGVKGVEFIETMPESKDGPRRHQWIGYRNYMGQTQMLNIMLSTKGSNFEKHRNDFPAVLYSTKIQQ